MNCELPRYFGSVSYWIRRAAGCPVADNALFDKRRKEIHRYTIADVNGPLTLTLPIVKPHGVPRATWEDVRISDHNRWWDIHRVALESAYGRTPYFEFYIDRFLPFLSSTTPGAFPSILSLNRALEAEISSILLLNVVSDSRTKENLFDRGTEADFFDRRTGERVENHLPEKSRFEKSLPEKSFPKEKFPKESISEKLPKDEREPFCGLCPERQLREYCHPSEHLQLRENRQAGENRHLRENRPLPAYWQPRADRLGFLPDLSILDLIFCLGPEAAPYIIHNSQFIIHNCQSLNYEL